MLKLLFPLIQIVISLNVYSQDAYLKVTQILQSNSALHIAAVDEEFPQDTIHMISLYDTVYNSDKRPLNHFWGDYGNYVILKVGESYPFYTFDLPYTYIKDLGYILIRKGVVISFVEDKKNLPKGIANSFGWTLQWWNPIFPHRNRNIKPYK